MTSPQSRPPVDARHARLMTGVSLMAAIGTLVIWFTDRQHGLATAWDLWTIPMLSALYFGIGVLHIAQPRCMPLALPPTLIATSVYLLVAIHLAMGGPSLPKLYAVTSLTQLIPVFYVVAFVAWPRGGAWISGFTYAGLLALYLFSLQAPMPTGGGSEVHLLTQKALLASLLIHPLASSRSASSFTCAANSAPRSKKPSTAKSASWPCSRTRSAPRCRPCWAPSTCWPSN